MNSIKPLLRVSRKVLQRATSLTMIVFMLANTYLPYYAYAPRLVHADAPPALSFSYDTGKNEFSLSVNSSVDVQYSVVYARDNNGTIQQEGVNGSGTDASGTFSRTLFAGTCSLLSCVKHNVKYGLVKVQVPTANWIYEKVFEINAQGEFVVKKEGLATMYEMTEAETAWMSTPTDEALGKIELAGQSTTPSTEKECMPDGLAYTSSTWLDWNTEPTTEVSTTKEAVKLGMTYVFPIEEKVSVTFTCLPKDESLRKPLKIQRVRVADLQLPADVRPAGEFAYDITTDMADGTFTYEVALPKAVEQTAEVKYIEKTVAEAKAQPVAAADVKEVVVENVE